MLILNHDKSYFEAPFTMVPYDRDQDGGTWRDVRGSMGGLFRDGLYPFFAEICGCHISLHELCQYDWRFRLRQKRHDQASIKLTYYHPTLRLSFQFKMPAKELGGRTIKALMLHMTRKEYFRGAYNTNDNPMPVAYVYAPEGKYTYPEKLWERMSKDMSPYMIPIPKPYDTNPEVFQTAPQTIIKEVEKIVEKVVEVSVKIDTLTTMELIDELERRYKKKPKDRKSSLSSEKAEVKVINNAA